jgi:hypothetical protein
MKMDLKKLPPKGKFSRKICNNHLQKVPYISNNFETLAGNPETDTQNKIKKD